MSGCVVHSGGIHPRTTKIGIERFFKGFGRIRDIDLKIGYGIVEFEDHRDADDAVYEMNNQTLCGGHVAVRHWRRDRVGGFGGGRCRDYGGGRYGGREKRGHGGCNRFGGSRFGLRSRTNYRLIVENVSSRVGCQDLKYLFRPVGEVTFAEVHQYIKGEGMVDFATHSDLKNAIEKLDNSDLMGRNIRLVEAKSHSRSRSRSRSSNRSRFYSRSPKRRSRSPRRRSRSASVENGNDRDGSKFLSPVQDRARSVSKSP